MAGAQANNLLTISMITREALRVLENSLTFTKQIARTYSDQFAISGAKIGTVLNIRKPPRYAGRIGQAIALEDSVETSIPLALTTQRGVDLAFTSAELTLSVDDFGRRFLRPAILGVANRIDFDACGLVVGRPPAQVSGGGPGWIPGPPSTFVPSPPVYNVVGTPVGTIPGAALTYLQAGQRLNEEACPVDDRVLVMPPSFVPPIVDSLKGLFQSAERIAEQYDRGMMGIALGFRWFMDQNMPNFTSGTAATGGTVSGAGQTGPLLTVSATTGTLNVGDVITIAGVYAVNPQNQVSTTALRNFSITANVASGATVLPIYPPIQLAQSAGGGPNGTVSALPAAGAAITKLYTASQTSGMAVAFHPEAFTFASADLLLPGGVDMAARVADEQLGFSIRAVRAYEIALDRFPTRLDILYGFGTLYQEMAVRIGG